MMKQQNKIPIWLCMIWMFLLCTSCEKSLDYQIQNQKSKLVMYSFPMPDSTLSLHVSYTTDILSLQNYTNVNAARATVKVNNEIVSDVDFPSEGESYVFQDIKVKSKDTIDITVNVKDSLIINAVTKIPVPAQIISIDTVRIMEFNDDNEEEEMLKCNLGIYDVAASKNYYQIKVDAHTKVVTEDRNRYQVETVEIVEQDKVFLSSDYEAVLIADIDYQSTFNDFLFNGQFYTVSFLIPNKYLTANAGENKRMLHFYLYSLSPEYYEYVRSVSEQEAFREDPFYEQSNVFSNVSNGLGLVGGLSVDVDSILVVEEIN